MISRCHVATRLPWRIHAASSPLVNFSKLNSGTLTPLPDPLVCTTPRLSTEIILIVSDSWTIHGLWPDYCDGTYPQFCDKSREYSDIKSIVSKFLGNATLSYMDKYWVSQDGDDESFWEHEWDKHGTCISTLEPSCYSGYKSGEEAADYIKKTISLFKELPTYKWLAEAGIEPSDEKTYTYEEIEDALAGQHGARVTIGCKGKTLSEVWYHFNVKGSLQEGEFVAAEPDGSKGSCPDSGIKYAPKN